MVQASLYQALSFLLFQEPRPLEGSPGAENTCLSKSESLEPGRNSDVDTARLGGGGGGGGDGTDDVSAPLRDHVFLCTEILKDRK